MKKALSFFIIFFCILDARARLTKGVKLQGLDKTTGRVFSIETKINHPIKFGTLTIIPRACQQSREEEEPESTAFLEIWEHPINGLQEKILGAWMFSSSPAVSALDHPVYDVWVTTCVDTII